MDCPADPSSFIGLIIFNGEINKIILIGKPEGKRPLGGPGRRRERNVRMNVRGNRLRRCGLDASGSGQGAVAAPF
jgi:hypothetical protein